MKTTRRTLIAALGALLLKPLAAFAAWNEQAFGAKTAADALKTLGASSPAASGHRHRGAADRGKRRRRADRGFLEHPGTASIAVLIEKNPFPLAGRFEFKDGALPYVKLNVKMGETSDVRVIATAGGKHFAASREIKVTIGGCGG